jgi:hypothetical protein
MITEIIKLVQTDDFYNVNSLVEIAKGRDETITIKNLIKKIKRQIKYKK